MAADDGGPAAQQGGNDVLRYVAILKAGRDFGLRHEEVVAVAGPFRAARPRCDELADALADLILARTLAP